MTNTWNRRAWLTRTTAVFGAMSPLRRSLPSCGRTPWRVPVDADTAARVAAQSERIDLGPLQQLALHALDAAHAAGGRYTDIRLTRTVGHAYQMQSGAYEISEETERIGVGVRTLVDGYWGFAAGAFWDRDAVSVLARDAVAQANTNATVSAHGSMSATLRTVELGTAPVVTGTWATPILIDPFHVSVEEKLDNLQYWDEVAHQHGMYFRPLYPCRLEFIRQERVVATSDGTLVTQTTYVTGGNLAATNAHDPLSGPQRTASARGLDFAGQGWELIVDAKIPEQLAAMRDGWAQEQTPRQKGAVVGKYTVVCDGATMAALLQTTLGVATQLDRALGYEANAHGTSFIDDPLAMVGQLHVASPLVTVTANRSAPTQLATIQWDDEGIVPTPFTVVKDGVLVDFQTTREQAAWLAPYYQRSGRPMRSHGCAASEDALMTPLQMMPNLALEPGPAAVRLDDLVANVPDGILITGGYAEADFQARTGRLAGTMREIKNGKVGASLIGGEVLYDTNHLWSHVMALGGPGTTNVVANCDNYPVLYGGYGDQKGEPSQRTNFSVQAVAATITDQPLVRSRA